MEAVDALRRWAGPVSAEGRIDRHSGPSREKRGEASSPRSRAVADGDAKHATLPLCRRRVTILLFRMA